jgi:ATP-dependent helicase/nuclease subunit A
VINLLLNGVEPEKILCITFTKAAAANMAKRVFDTLAEWTTFDDAKLDEDQGWFRGRAGSARAARLGPAAVCARAGNARRAQGADHPRLLHAAPASISVRSERRRALFSVLDETEQSQLLERLTLNVLLDGAGDPGSALGACARHGHDRGADQTFRDVVREAIGKRDASCAG